MKSFEQYLNIERTVVDLNEQWLLDDPSDNNQSLSKYMGEVSRQKPSDSLRLMIVP